MAVDYDVVIIGGSQAGRYAAVAATQLGATVALIEPQAISIYSPLLTHALTIGQYQQLNNAQFGIHQNSEPVQWAEGVVSNLEEQNSPVVLASLGVDVILGQGEFQRLPNLAFSVNGRRLRARAYLIATNSRPVIPDMAGLQTAGYVTALEVWRLLSPELPKRWVILGADPDGIQLAQTLAQFGLNVTLIVKRSHILDKEDPEIAQLIQATLEAEGVRVLTGTLVTQVKCIQDKKWVQAGNEAIETDEILVCAGQQPNVETLNLEAVGVQWHQRRLILNEKLQTTNRRIYACGDVNGGYHPNIANYEAQIALKNALFFPVFKVNYRSIPWAIFSNPQLARVGLTEAQARRTYGRDVVVLRQYFKSMAAAQLSGETTGICKLIVLLHSGEILGSSIVGPQAGELINVVALAIAQNIKINAIAQLVPVYPSLSEILDQIASNWTKSKLTRNSQLRNFLEGFFNFRRSWSR